VSPSPTANASYVQGVLALVNIVEKRHAYHLITVPGVGQTLPPSDPFGTDLVVTAIMDFLAIWGSRPPRHRRR